jgi:hypothetical protein
MVRRKAQNARSLPLKHYHAQAIHSPPNPCSYEAIPLAANVNELKQKEADFRQQRDAYILAGPAGLRYSS